MTRDITFYRKQHATLHARIDEIEAQVFERIQERLRRKEASQLDAILNRAALSRIIGG